MADLFEATEGEERRLKWGRFRGRAPPPSSVLVARLLLAVVLVAIIAISALAVSVWALVRSDGEGTAGVPETATARTIEPPKVAESEPAAETPPAKSAGFAPTKLVLTGARGDCWLEARVGSATGKLLFTGTLEQGRSIRLTERRLWIAFGAGANLDVTLNGRRVERFPTGTAAVFVTAKGVRAATGS